MKKILLSLLCFLILFQVKSQQVLTENFDYTSTQTLVSNGWTQIGTSATNPISVSSAGLTYSGYTLSGIGNAAIVNTTGQDVYKDGFVSTNSGSVYVSFMIYPSSVQAAGDYFFALLPSNSTTNYVSRIFLKLSSTGYYKVGISKYNETAVYSTDSFALSTISLLIAKYQFIAGTSNDSVSLFHFSSGLPSSEPSPLLIANGTGLADASNISRVALRQGSPNNAPTLAVDGIRMAQSWADLNTPTSTAPNPLTQIAATAITTNSARINLTRPANFDGLNSNVLVYLKKGNSISTGNPTRSVASIFADSNFNGIGSSYDFDTAVCVYNNDSNFVVVTGLNQSTSYIAVGYVVSEADSVYSLAKVSSVFTTLSSAPNSATGLTFTSTSPSSARVSWNKANNYDNATQTQVVFVKELSSIGTGLNNENPIYIYADSNYEGVSSRYQNDTAARCVYKGDLNSVIVTNLKPGTRYYVVVLGVNEADSNYSNGTTANVLMPSDGPAGLSNIKFNGRLETNSSISWTKPSGYNPLTETVLVFLRKDSLITSFPAPSIDPINYVADSNYLTASSGFEGDQGAKCVYNGDGDAVNILNLQLSSNYLLIAYVVKTDTVSYSNPSFANGKTMLEAPTNISVKGLSASSVNITWTSPAGFINGTYNTLIFVKANSVINSGTPTRAVARYFASTTFGSGTKYQNDSMAYCIYKGNANTVNLTNLVQGVDYYVSVFVVRVADSVYSHEATSMGTTLGQPPVYAIGPLVNTNLTTGVVDSNAVRATIRGVVYGKNNITGNGLQFVLRDATGGISVTNTAKNFGYTVNEGDSIEVAGTVAQTRGLAILTNLDTIKFISARNSIQLPKYSTIPSELTENDLVYFNNLKLATPMANWPNNGTVITKNQITGDTVRVRIYTTSLIGGTPTPTGEFTLIGLGSQSSTSNTAPFAFNGYSIVPRGVNDIIAISADSLSAFNLLSPLASPTINLEGDTAQLFTFSSQSTKIEKGSGTVFYTFLMDNFNGNFNSPIYGKACDNGGTDTTGSITYGELAKQGLITLQQGDSIVIKITIMASLNGYTRLANNSALVTFKRGFLTGIQLLNSNQDMVVYPNPASQQINVMSNENASLKLYDLQGKLVQESEITNAISVQNVKEGIYLLAIETKTGKVYKRVEVKH